jgi:uncharacterized protein YdhG (YjbR/CyaY superfamily)
MDSRKFKTVDEYFSVLPAKVKTHMKDMRVTIRKAAPQAEEVISYNMPAFKYQGMLVYYAAHTEHIGFYPVSSAIRAFEKDLIKYERSKGTIRFPLDKPIPINLVSKIVKFRVKENSEKAIAKNNKKTSKK